MVKLFDFEYHVKIWFEYDRFGFNLSRPSLGSPLMVWCTEINSSDTFWSFPNCPKMTNFPKSDHFQAFRKWPKCITGTDFGAFKRSLQIMDSSDLGQYYLKKTTLSGKKKTLLYLCSKTRCLSGSRVYIHLTIFDPNLVIHSWTLQTSKHLVFFSTNDFKDKNVLYTVCKRSKANQKYLF